MYAQNISSGHFRVLFEPVLTEAEKNISYKVPKGSIGARHSSGRAQDSPSAAAELINNYGEISPFNENHNHKSAVGWSEPLRFVPVLVS